MNTRLAPRLLLIALLCAGFAWGTWAILQNPPPARKPRTEAPLPLMRVLASQPSDHPLLSRVYGTVQAAHAMTVRPQVGGRLQRLHPAFEPGGVIPAGEPLYQIDPSDFDLAIKAAQADLAKVRADIEIEQGRRKVAAEELRLLEGSIKVDAGSRELALREPQLRQVRAELLSAQNALEEARLQRQRTQASLPYDAVVLSRARVGGEVVAARDSLGEVAQADRFWISLQVPQQLLRRLHARTGDRPGSPVTVIANGVEYPAEVTRILAELSPDSRLARVIAEVQDPLGKQHPGRPPLLIGSYVEADIDSGSLADSIAVPRSALRDDRVWVADANDRLQVRDVKVLFTGPETAYLAPLPPGDRVLMTPPVGLAPDTPVRVEVAR
jgi:RND family efflux transporter MFP subunit